jgi:hypothetical protein
MADIYSVAQTVDNTGTTVATAGSNSLKTAERTQFGTRELSTIKVVVGGTAADVRYQDGASSGLSYTLSNSVYSAAVRALQSFGEVYAVYAPVATGFIAIVATDTLNSSASGNGTNPIATTFTLAETAMAAAVDAAKASATKDSTVTITLPTIAIGTTL